VLIDDIHIVDGAELDISVLVWLKCSQQIDHCLPAAVEVLSLYHLIKRHRIFSEREIHP